MGRIKLAALYGGDSAEREVSFMSWRAVKEHLNTARYELFGYDLKTDLRRLVADAPSLDAAIICLHGRGGEDGTVQGLLELLKIPYQGSGVLASAAAMNKRISKELFTRAGLKIPRYRVAVKNQKADFDNLGKLMPCMVKPVHEGSSMGMSRVERVEDLQAALEKAFGYDRKVLVEEYIEGVEVTGGILGLEDPQPLPLVEIIPRAGHAFFDFTAKYDATQTDEICPARISSFLTRASQQAALTAHRALGCRGYSRTDMIIRGEDIYVLETNTLPGMTATSLLPQAAKEAGIEFSQLLDMLIDMALEVNER